MNDTELASLLALLEASHRLDPGSVQYLAVERAAAHLFKSAKKKRRAARARATRAADAAASAQVGLPRVRAGQAPTDGPAPQLRRERTCYACKRPFRQMHRWYPWLCESCGETSAAAREVPLELPGARALVTGGRVKVGEATALRLLRAGAEVHVTTRFPADARRRYLAQPDHARWASRLVVHGLDFRDLGGLVRWLGAFAQGPALDLLVNNAAQSTYTPPNTVRSLYAGEDAAAQRPGELLAAVGAASLQALDLTRQDSWVQSLGELSAVDLVEAQVVNAVAPALIVNALLPALRRSTQAARGVVNVTAVEGQFSRPEKPARHPHTNMAKAALNMLTRTSASALSAEGLFMVSVDPGWLLDGPGRGGAEPRLEPDDCAARVLHPVACALAGQPLSGVLLKDFREVPW